MRNLLYSLAIIMIISLLNLSCTRDEQITTVNLPPTQVLEQNTNFAAITSSHLRLRVEPSIKAKPITTLWKGYILEIISRSSRKEIVEDHEDYWYQISYDGLQGWVFGAYVKIFPSLEKAKEEVKKLQQ